MAGRRPTKLEEEARLDTVTRWFGEGLYDSELVYRIMDEYQLSEAASRECLKKAYVRIHKGNLEDIDTLRKESVARHRELYAKAVANKDLSTAAKVESQLAKLLGMNAPEKKDVTSNGETIQVVINEPSRDPKFNLATEIEVAEGSQPESS